jgi:putative ABC transport system permease protein
MKHLNFRLMIKLVLRQLFFEPANTLITLLALASAIAMIVVLQGFEQGQYEQLRRASLNRGADLIAVQSRVSNFVATRSVIPQLVREKIESTKGVLAVHPLTTLPVVYSKNGLQTPVYLIVFDSAGGPAKLIQGVAKNRGQFIVIDTSLAKKYQLKPGDDFRVSGFDFKISGITQEAALMMPFAFINYDGLIDLFLESEIAPDLSTFPLLSFMLIDLADRDSLFHIQQTLEQNIPDIDVFTPGALAANDEVLGKAFYEPILGLLISVGFVLGLLLISLLMYTAIHRKQRDFAIMLALGFKPRALLHYTTLLSCTLLFIAFIVSLAIAGIIAFWIESVRPVYYFAVYQPQVLREVGGMVLIFALTGAALPYFSLRGCDPVIALHRAD